jgi:hypothetical protein
MISHIFESQKVLWNPIKSHEVSWNLIKSLKSHEVVEVSESLMKSYEVPWILMESQKVLWSFSKSFGSLSKIWSLYCWSLWESFEIFRSLLKSWSLEVGCFPLEKKFSASAIVKCRLNVFSFIFEVILSSWRLICIRTRIRQLMSVDARKRLMVKTV